MKEVLLAFIVFSSILQVLGKLSDGRHPIYNIAHMVNSIRELEDYLRRGANAIESDVTFTNRGLVDSTYHGYPCDCFRMCNRKEDFANYISYVRNITIPGSENYKENFTLLFLDIKSSSLAPQVKYTAGKSLANDLVKYLWNGGDDLTPINIIICIGHTRDSDIIRGLQDTLRRRNLEHLFSKIGYDVGLNDDPQLIANMWKGLGIKKHIWQGDGITNCFSPLRSNSRLRQLIKMRKSDESYMCKVYQWTIDFTMSFRRSLRLGVEAFITNYPERLNSVLHESGIRQHYRLATIHDNCWEPVPIYPSVVNDLITTQPISNNVYSVAQEVVDSLVTFVRDATNANISRGINAADYLPIMNLIVSTDRSEPEIADAELFCQHALCTLFDMYGNRTPAAHPFHLDSECRKGSGTPGEEIFRICTSLQKLMYQCFKLSRMLYY